jgi:secondary thiamine-phosphate synthase enzyme
MQIVTDRSIRLQTGGNGDMIDITRDVQEVINEHGFREGNALIFVSGSTAALTTIEYEPGLQKDYPQFFEKIIPSNVSYNHDQTWGDGNGHSHLRASLQGPSLQVPFADGKLLLGTWQQIILLDFDNRSRNRNIIVQLTGIS